MLSRVLIAVGELRRRDAGKDEAWAEAPRQPRQQPGAEPRHEMLILDTNRRKFLAPQARMAAFGLRQLQKQVFAEWIRLCRGQRRVKSGAIQFIAQVGPIAFDVVDHAVPRVANRRASDAASLWRIKRAHLR